MLGILLRHGGESAKIYFQESAGEELIELWEESPNQKVRHEVTSFAEEFFRSSLNDNGDIIYCQSYQSSGQVLHPKTNDERYYNNDEKGDGEEGNFENSQQYQHYYDDGPGYDDGGSRSAAMQGTSDANFLI